MTNEQFKKANAAVYPVILVISLFIFLLLVAGIIKKGFVIKIAIQIIVSFIAIIVSTVGFVKYRDNELGGRLILGSGIATYLGAMIFGTSQFSFMYVFPMIICIVAYLDVKRLMIYNALAFIAFVYH